MDADADAGGIAIALLHLSAGALKLQEKIQKRLKFQDFNLHILHMDADADADARGIAIALLNLSAGALKIKHFNTEFE